MKSSPERRRWSAWRSQANANARPIRSRSAPGAPSPACSSRTAKRSPRRRRSSGPRTDAESTVRVAGASVTVSTGRRATVDACGTSPVSPFTEGEAPGATWVSRALATRLSLTSARAPPSAGLVDGGARPSLYLGRRSGGADNPKALVPRTCAPGPRALVGRARGAAPIVVTQRRATGDERQPLGGNRPEPLSGRVRRQRPQAMSDAPPAARAIWRISRIWTQLTGETDAVASRDGATGDGMDCR